MSDQLVRAISKDGFVKAAAVSTRALTERARQIHQTSPVATAALGRLLAAGSMMGNELKGDGSSVTLRIKGDGPLGTLLVVADNEGNVRGSVQNPQIDLPIREDGKLDVGGAVGHGGTLTVIKDLNLKEPYVGSVDLLGGEIAEDLASYFVESEQIPTACGLGVLVDRDRSVLRAGGYLIQLLPGAPEGIIDRLEKGIMAAGPVTNLLLENDDPESLLRRVMKDFELEILETVPVEYRCYCSRDIRNLFLAGRCISASHVAHGSTRVMATSGFGAQAIGMAAALCLQKGVLPADLTRPEFMRLLQQRLNLAGQSIPGIRIDSAGNLAASARISASSELRLAEIPFDGGWMPLDYSAAQLLPLKAGVRYRFEIEVEACEATVLEAELRYAAKPFNYTPDMTAERVRIPVETGTCKLSVVFTGTVPSDQYGFVTFLKNNALRIRSSKARYTGIVSVFNKFNEAVNNNGRQTPPAGSGIDAFEFWCPDRRPAGQNIAMRITPAIEAFSPSNVVNGFVRPTVTANAWCAAFGDKMPRLSFCWDVPQRIGRIRLFFDTDYDHALESVQMGHPERVIPFCVQGYRILDGHGNVVCECTDNHQTINDIRLKETLETDRLAIVVEHPSSEVAAALFQIHIEA